MQPIPKGVILNKRYRIARVLGSGGFGRTYLAEDTSRYDEICVLKEYNPNLEGTYALEKSQELFEREAQILYKIEHPRIPKFQATFEQGKRLFLAQDYVKGKTYKALLDDRIKENKTFSPGEVVQFLQQMLPVLEHIHSKGIIHRDISPDNIICRECDRLPVLIDFGAVKEIGSTQLGALGKSIQGTNVGKHGYSPPEQLQKGKVYPNSDLYSLAATAVVLMTGRKPEELLNEQTTTWRWHQWVPTLELWLAQLLNKMLSPKPDKRYQSATEVAKDLRTRAGLMGTGTHGNSIKDHRQKVRKKVTDSSRAKYNSGNAIANHKKKVETASPGLVQTLLNQSKAAQVLRAAIVLFVTVGTVQLLRVPPQKVSSSTVTAKAPETLGTDATMSPEVVAQPVVYDIPMTVFVGKTASDRRRMKAHETYRYKIYVESGQVLSAAVDTEEVLMSVLGSNLKPNNNQATGVSQWSGTLENEGSYYIEVSLAPEKSQSEYQLDISLTDRATAQIAR